MDKFSNGLRMEMESVSGIGLHGKRQHFERLAFQNIISFRFFLRHYVCRVPSVLYEHVCEFAMDRFPICTIISKMRRVVVNCQSRQRAHFLAESELKRNK